MQPKQMKLLYAIKINDCFECSIIKCHMIGQCVSCLWDVRVLLPTLTMRNPSCSVLKCWSV